MPSRQGIVSITLKDGTNLTHHTKAVRGTAENPMSRAEVDAKCYDLLAPITGKRRARRLCDTVWTLDSLTDVRKLRRLLQVA
jgi:2-methylcitrate dehydratase PrpD